MAESELRKPPFVRLNPNGFFYMFAWWPQPLRWDGIVFGYSWLGFWWWPKRRTPECWLR